jgi:hypothetical protein
MYLNNFHCYDLLRHEAYALGMVLEEKKIKLHCNKF